MDAGQAAVCMAALIAFRRDAAYSGFSFRLNKIILDGLPRHIASGDSTPST
jgi:hypothetical protein